ncbi:MAG TPA: low affinity iron permease family protein [Actinomycetota bacterium]|nr:low affinity iron permease family protein [Actinomycetota bacterium]
MTDRGNRQRTMFDQFAERSSELVSRTPFFVFCVALVVLWLPTYPLAGNFDTWQLLINTPTTILTFLLVAILQNSQRRTEIAMQEKLNALADGLADLMEHFTGEEADEEIRTEDLLQDVKELKEAVGLEQKI